MRFAPDSISGRRLRMYGVSSNALRKARVFALPWLPVPAFTVPFPFVGCTILVRRNLLDMELDGELADSPALAVLVHQYCHAHQRLEWGFPRYVWRHLWSRAVPRGIPVRHRHVERECYEAARQVEELHSVNTEV